VVALALKKNRNGAYEITANDSRRRMDSDTATITLKNERIQELLKEVDKARDETLDAKSALAVVTEELEKSVESSRRLGGVYKEAIVERDNARKDRETADESKREAVSLAKSMREIAARAGTNLETEHQESQIERLKGGIAGMKEENANLKKAVKSRETTVEDFKGRITALYNGISCF